jgi:hypothetical protein
LTTIIMLLIEFDDESGRTDAKQKRTGVQRGRGPQCEQHAVGDLAGRIGDVVGTIAQRVCEPTGMGADAR